MHCSTIVYTKSGNLNDGPGTVSSPWSQPEWRRSRNSPLTVKSTWMMVQEQSPHREVRPLKGNAPTKPGTIFVSDSFRRLCCYLRVFHCHLSLILWLCSNDSHPRAFLPLVSTTQTGDVYLIPKFSQKSLISTLLDDCASPSLWSLTVLAFRACEIWLETRPLGLE